MRLLVHIPGEPFAQPRPRSTTIAGRAHVYEPTRARNWKATAQDHIARACGHPAALLEGALRVHLVCLYALPRSSYRKRPVAMSWHTKRGDTDNLAKICLDSANGIWWKDDAQVSELHVEKVVASQGVAPGVFMGCETIEESPGDGSYSRKLSEAVWDLLYS